MRFGLKSPSISPKPRSSSGQKVCSQRFAQDLVRPAQLAVLSLQRLHPLDQFGRTARALAAVDLGLLDPVIERMRRATDLRAIDTMACQREPCWPSVSSTSRTARSRTSGENLFVVLLMMLHPTQELEPPVFAKSAMKDGAGGIPRASGAIDEARLPARESPVSSHSS